MEPVLIASYTRLREAHGCSVDDILEDPVYRTQYLALVRASCPERGERDILHGLTNLRKRSKLPRRGTDSAA